MTDYILQLVYRSGDFGVEERIAGAIYLAGVSSSTVEQNGSVVVSVYFDDEDSRRQSHESLSDISGLSINEENRTREDWLKAYEQSLCAIEIGARFVVAPDLALIDLKCRRLPILIPQERAFGTGSHETTALCLELLEGAGVENSRAADYGTGSGILAIGMSLLGAKKVFACDNDPDTLGIVADNLARNSVAPDAVSHFIGSPESLRFKFDLITMNILPDVILSLLSLVVSQLSSGGTLIVSGILVTRRDEVLKAAQRSGLRLDGEMRRGEWWAGRLRA